MHNFIILDETNVAKYPKLSNIAPMKNKQWILDQSDVLKLQTQQNEAIAVFNIVMVILACSIVHYSMVMFDDSAWVISQNNKIVHEPTINEYCRNIIS